MKRIPAYETCPYCGAYEELFSHHCEEKTRSMKEAEKIIGQYRAVKGPLSFLNPMTEPVIYIDDYFGWCLNGDIRNSARHDEAKACKAMLKEYKRNKKALRARQAEEAIAKRGK